MRDTTPEMKKRFHLMLRQKTGEERLRMGCSMYETAKRLVVSSILDKDPNASPAELRRQMFLRFYGTEFSPEKREHILKRL